MSANKYQSAYPIFDAVRIGMDYGCRDDGMTLRAWFAGQALSGFTSTGSNESYQDIARRCFKMADAMMEENEK